LVRKFSRIVVYNALAVPILLYGSEIWNLRREDKNDWYQSRLSFSEEQPSTLFLTTKEMQKFWKICKLNQLRRN
jgi:hypothetical protein